MCSWAQELGRAGRGGQNDTATIYYSTSDIDHAGIWIKEHLRNFDHCNTILQQFGYSWQYVMSHLSGQCRRKVFLNHFEEDLEDNSDDSCCDVCTNQLAVTRIDRTEELHNMVNDAIDTIGLKKELKNSSVDTRLITDMDC